MTDTTRHWWKETKQEKKSEAGGETEQHYRLSIRQKSNKMKKKS